MTVAASCSDSWIDFFDGRPCPYNVRLQYGYNLENTVREDQLPRFAQSMEEMVFDARGVLFSITAPVIDASGHWASELMLPEGRYSVIALANRNDRNEITDGGHPLKVGETTRENVMAALTGDELTGGDGTRYFDNGDALFYGYRTFTVKGGEPVRVNVDMVNIHLELNFVIYWKDDQVPPDTDDFYLQLSDIPSEYSLMPAFVYPTPAEPAETFVPEKHDLYEPGSDRTIHYVVGTGSGNVVTQRRKAEIKGQVMSARIVGYRIGSTGQATIGLYRANAAENGGADQRLMEDVRLNTLLRRIDADLDHSLRQKYEVVFVVDPSTGGIVP